MGEDVKMTYLKRIVLYIMNVVTRLGEERWKIEMTYFFHYPRDLRLIPSDNMYFNYIYS
jgi:hypothetical protein